MSETCSIPPVRMLCSLMSVQLVFIATHWEKYNTGVLFLSWGYDLSQYVSNAYVLCCSTKFMGLFQGLSLFYLLTYILGHEFWQFYIVNSWFSFANLLECFFYLTCAASVIMSLYNIHQ